MKQNRSFFWFVLVALMGIAALPSVARAQGTAFTYQGRLTDALSPANGSYDLTFSLFSGSSGTGQVGGTLASIATPVSNGLFIVTLDFGANFTGADRWLEIAVRTNGTGTFTNLIPRQRLTATPYAVTAGTVTGVIPSASLSGLYAGPVTMDNPGNVFHAALFAGVFTGNGAGLTNLPGTFRWQVVPGSSQQAEPNTGYVAQNPNGVTINLPIAPAVGDTVRVSGAGAGGWTITQNSGQQVFLPNFDVGNATGIQNWFDVTSSDDGSKLVVVTESGRIYTSTNSGANWTPTGSSRSWRSVASSADGSKLVAVVSGGQIYTSTDSGGTWTPRDSNRNWISVASSADGKKLVAVVGSGQVYTSTDSGVNWTPRDSDRSWKAVASAADGSKLVAVVEFGLIYASTDSGVTWTPRDSNRAWSSVASSADGSQLVATVGGGQIYTSTDSGVNWTPRDSNRSWKAVASSADGSKLVAAVTGVSVFTSTDSGVNWTPRIGGGFWGSVASSADGSQLVAVLNPGKILRSTDSGATWTSPIPSTLLGPNGYLTGGPFTAIELQYIGGGQFFPISHAGTFITGY